VSEPVTIRIDGGNGVASRDDGSTRALTETETTQIQALVAKHLPFEYAMPSAVARAALAEAREAQPRTTAIPMPAPPFPEGIEIALAIHARELTMPFQSVLSSRRSRRTLESLTLQDLATLLCATGRIIEWAEAGDGFQKTSRPVPSAGGRHPCELLVAISDARDIAPGLWLFHPLRCTLIQLPVPPTLESAMQAVSTATLCSPAPTTVFVVGDMTRTLSRYPAGTTLAWRDAGAVLATLHLAATAASLNSCIVGTSGVLIYDQATTKADLGALVVGREPRSNRGKDQSTHMT
jgi:SagB-type dehydrogenase family enzyme